MIFNRKRKKTLEQREQELETRERNLKIMYLDMVISAHLNKIQSLKNLEFDAIK